MIRAHTNSSQMFISTSCITFCFTHTELRPSLLRLTKQWNIRFEDHNKCAAATTKKTVGIHFGLLGTKRQKESFRKIPEGHSILHKSLINLKHAFNSVQTHFMLLVPEMQLGYPFKFK